MQNNRLDISAVIDGARISAVQLRVFILCAIVAMLDGFDTQSIAFVAPAIAQDWHMPAASFGPIFSIGLFGLMVGQLTLSLLSDRAGRRITIILSTLVFALFTGLTAAAGDWNQLFICRFLAGFGLGGAIPNVIAITSEFSPRDKRATLVATVFGGFPLGAVLGGYIALYLIPHFGWRSVFWLGAAAPLLLLVPLWLGLSESPRFLCRTAPEGDKLKALMAAISPEAVGDGRVFYEAEAAGAGAKPSLSALFASGWAARTLFLWATFFMSLLVVYFLINWLPLIFKERGYSMQAAVSTSIVLNIGGGIGGILIGRMIDRFGPFAAISLSYLAGAAAVIGLGAWTPESPWILMLVVFVAGFCSVGTQTGLSAFTSNLYPTHIRSIGVGSGLAVGRAGAIVGPSLAGFMLSQGVPISILFYSVAGPFVVASLLVLAVRMTMRPKAPVPAPA